MNKFILLVLGITLINASTITDFLYQPGNVDPLEEVQDLFNGFWEQGNLSDPSGLAASCFNETSAQFLLDTLGQIIGNLTQNNVIKALGAASHFYQSVPDCNKCMIASPYTKELFNAYGLSNLTVAQIDARIATYIVTHLDQVHQEVVNANNDIQNQNYVQAGKDGGVFILQVFKGQNDD